MDILCEFMHETQLFVETADLPIEGKKRRTKIESPLVL